MEFFRQEYWSGLPFPFPGDLPDPGIKPGSPALQADSLLSESLEKLGTQTVFFFLKKSYFKSESFVRNSVHKIKAYGNQIPR